MHKAIKNLLKFEGPTRDAVLKWFLHTIQLNLNRSKMHFDQTVTSSEAFCLNTTLVLIQMCSPFTNSMTPNFVKF